MLVNSKVTFLFLKCGRFIVTEQLFAMQEELFCAVCWVM